MVGRRRGCGEACLGGGRRVWRICEGEADTPDPFSLFSLYMVGLVLLIGGGRTAIVVVFCRY